MRVQTETKNVQRGGVLVESEFKIKATAKAFSILSSALYSDKILAIVRELACNAYDSHVAAGKKDVPIEIKLPTPLNPTFHVKDFGLGLSHEDVIELYSTYFDSSKTDSNDFIGALGLGSKSPFSYVQNFTVESRHNGTKRLYSMFLNERNIPAVSLLGQEKTSEPNGLTVSLAGNGSDSDKFKRAAQRALMYFTPMPNVIGAASEFEAFTLKHTVAGTNWKVRESDWQASMNGAYVVQGFVAYPIDSDILESNGLSNLGSTILSMNIDLYVPIGQVEVAASREALSYTKSTIKNLVSAVEVAEKEMRDSIQKEFTSCKSRWDAQMLHAKLNNHRNNSNKMYRQLSSAESFKWNGSDVTDKIDVDLSKIKNTDIQVGYMSGWSRRGKGKARAVANWTPSNVAKTFAFQVHANMNVLVDDIGRSTGVLTEYLTAQTKTADDGDKYALVLRGTTKTAFDQKEIDSIIKQLGIGTYDLLSKQNLQVAKQKYTYKARKSDEAILWKGFPSNGGYKRNQTRRVFSRLCWTGTKVDLYDKKTERFYVELERFAIVDKTKAQEYFDTFVSYMQALNILPKTVNVIGLNEKQVKLVKTNKVWHNVFRFSEQQFKEMNKTNVLTNFVIAQQVIGDVGVGFMNNIVYLWSSLEAKIVDGSFKDLVNTIVEINKAGKSCKYKLGDVLAVANLVSPTFEKDCKKRQKEIKDAFAQVMDDHAMLKLVDWSKFTSNDVDMIIEYVNFVAKN